LKKEILVKIPKRKLDITMDVSHRKAFNAYVGGFMEKAKERKQKGGYPDVSAFRFKSGNLSTVRKLRKR